MSEQARTLLSSIAERYASAGSPERSGFCFDAGSVTDAHRELEAAGVLQRVFGVPGGYAWRLSEAGLQQIKATA